MNILDYCRIIWRSRWPIVALVLIAAFVALGWVRMQPKVYSAKATILAPKETSPQSLSASLGALFGGSGGGGRDSIGTLPALLTGGPAISTSQDMFAAVLRSRTVREEVIAELAKTHGAQAGPGIVSVDTSLREKALISVTVEATDPQFAAAAANMYFQALDRIIERLAEQATRRQQAFYAEQLHRAAKEVAAAEEAVLKFQADNRVIPVDGPTRGAVDAGVNLRGTIMGLEMQREVMRLRMTEQHPQMRETEKQIAELKKQYSKNLFGAPMDLPAEGPGKVARKEFFVSTEKMTPVQFAYLKLYRNLKIQEAFYTGALQGLEQLKYNDGVQQMRVEMLDPAVPSPAPIRPRVLYTVQMAAGSALLLGTLLAFVVEYVRRARKEERIMRSLPGERAVEAANPLPPPDDRLLRRPDPVGAAGRGRP